MSAVIGVMNFVSMSAILAADDSTNSVVWLLTRIVVPLFGLLFCRLVEIGGWHMQPFSRRIHSGSPFNRWGKPAIVKITRSHSCARS